MWWWKQKKVLLDHPYFDCNSDVLLVRKETDRIYNSGFPTFNEMIDSAKERFGLPIDAWHNFDEAVASRGPKSRYETGYNFFAAHKRLAVAMMIVLFVISFLTLVPFGRALAADFFDMIMKAIDGRIEIHSENPDYEKYEYFNFVAEQHNEGGSEYIEDNAPIFYPSIEEFIIQTGYTPITFNTDCLKCQKIQSYENDVQGLTISIQYLTSDDAIVVVTQRWGNADIVFEVQNASYKKAMILENTELLYTIDPADGSFNGTAVLNDSILLIGAEKDVDIKNLLEILE